ncbi:flagellin [Mobiluncus mulieris]|uniref:flagellin N-terminal helical domain-containing protein n=1 Tax=Mobiluncus mulieris TaxID=2052 RepID=UPI0002E084E5
MAVLPGSGSGWVSILGMLRLLVHPTGMCKMPGQGVLGGLAKSLEKLSSGFRINRAADDAAGLAISEGLRSQVGGNRQAVRNAQDGISVIQTAEGALNEVHSILQRMRVLAVQGANDSNDSKSRNNIKAELTQLRDELNRIGNVTNFNGTKLLDGSASGNNAMKFQVGANGTDNDRIVVDLKDADVTTVSKFQVKGAKVSNITEAKAALTEKAVYAFNVDGKTLKLDMKTQVGGADPKLSEILENAIKESGLEGIISGAKTEIAEKINLVAATAFGDKTFKLEIGDKTLTYKVGSGDTSKGATVQAIADGLMADATRQGLQNDFKITGDDKGNFKIEDLRGANAPVVKVKLSADTANAVGTKKAGENLLTKGDRLGASATKGYVFDVDDTNKTIVMKRGDGKAIDIDMDHVFTQLGATAAGTGDKPVAWAAKKYADTTQQKDYVTQDVDFLSVETHEKAQKLIDMLDNKINSVSTARANLGAIQNRFEHTITNLNVAVENLAASESRIRDTDMAQEMMQFTRNQILSQAGTSMLAQANQVPQGVLSLLR